MTRIPHYSAEEAETIAEVLGVDLERYGLEQFRLGLDVEREHGSVDPVTDITHDDPLLIGRIVLAHLNKAVDYYNRLMEMQAQIDATPSEPATAEGEAEYC